MQDLNVTLETYEGPLDILINLIEKNKIDIYDIPISSLTDQYMEFIRNMEGASMESMSEFIVMAATLLEIKSKMLLPKDETENPQEETDHREELVRRLLEYKKFKQISEIFAEREDLSGQSVYKGLDKTIVSQIKKEMPPDIDEILNGVNLEMLFDAFEEVLKRKENKTDKIRSSFNSVTKSVFNINDKIQYISDLLVIKDKLSFKSIFRPDCPTGEIVVTFLAVLELIKMKKIIVEQNSIFDEITIGRVE